MESKDLKSLEEQVLRQQILNQFLEKRTEKYRKHIAKLNQETRALQHKIKLVKSANALIIKTKQVNATSTSQIPASTDNQSQWQQAPVPSNPSLIQPPSHSTPVSFNPGTI